MEIEVRHARRAGAVLTDDGALAYTRGYREAVERMLVADEAPAGTIGVEACDVVGDPVVFGFHPYPGSRSHNPHGVSITCVEPAVRRRASAIFIDPDEVRARAYELLVLADELEDDLARRRKREEPIA
jgi:hypothetical protein